MIRAEKLTLDSAGDDLISRPDVILFETFRAVARATLLSAGALKEMNATFVAFDRPKGDGCLRSYVADTIAVTSVGAGRGAP
jgi:hypothetical protein